MNRETIAENIWRGVLSRATAVTDNKKHRILEATISLIADTGIESVTFENIGKKLKTTKANIKYHFGDKDHLIFTAIQAVTINAQAMTAAQVEKAESTEDKLQAIIDAAYDWVQRYPEHLRAWILFIYYAQMHEPYAKYFAETRSVGQSRMALLLRALHHSGDKNADYMALAENIQNILYGQILGLTGRMKELKQNKAAANTMISMLLQSEGLKWPKKR